MHADINNLTDSKNWRNTSELFGGRRSKEIYTYFIYYDFLSLSLTAMSAVASSQISCTEFATEASAIQV